MKMEHFTYQRIPQLLFFTGYYKSRIIRWTGTVACIGTIRISHNILLSRTERKITLGVKFTNLKIEKYKIEIYE
jgi:hypothetical protein